MGQCKMGNDSGTPGTGMQEFTAKLTYESPYMLDTGASVHPLFI